jgi:hypothetical protein
MIVAAFLAAVISLVATGLMAWTARLVQARSLDNLALAAETGTPDPASALDWPELHVRAVVPQPDEQSLILLLVGWPARRQKAATLLVAVDSDDHRSAQLLTQWCETQASVSPTRCGGAHLEFRRHQSPERVHAVLVAEDAMPGSPT